MDVVPCSINFIYLGLHYIISTFEHICGYSPCSIPPTVKLKNQKNPKNPPVNFSPNLKSSCSSPVPTVCLCVHFLVEMYVSTVSVPPHPSPFNSHRSTRFPHFLCRERSRHRNGRNSSFLGKALDRAIVLCQSARLSSVSAAVWKPDH